MRDEVFSLPLPRVGGAAGAAPCPAGGSWLGILTLPPAQRDQGHSEVVNHGCFNIT